MTKPRQSHNTKHSEHTDQTRSQHLSRLRQKALSAELPVHINTELLRGWSEDADPTLNSAHILPPLAHLTLIDPHFEQYPKHASSSSSLMAPSFWDIHNPDIILGRYSTHIGPTDIALNGLLDHELYTICAPHIKLTMLDEDTWHLTRLSPQAIVKINGKVITKLHTNHEVRDGDTLTLGVVDLRFEINPNLELHQWEQQQRDLLRTQQLPAIFLKRHGGICGPRFNLQPDKSCVLGRSFSGQNEPWASTPQPDWNLSGLTDYERRFIAFRHATLQPTNDNDWEVVPLSKRQEVTVNRIPIKTATILQDGDEIGLGNVLFHFHNPLASQPSTRHTIKLPSAVDWHSEHSSLITLPKKPTSNQDTDPS